MYIGNIHWKDHLHLDTKNVYWKPNMDIDNIPYLTYELDWKHILNIGS